MWPFNFKENEVSNLLDKLNREVEVDKTRIKTLEDELGEISIAVSMEIEGALEKQSKASVELHDVKTVYEGKLRAIESLNKKYQKEIEAKRLADIEVKWDKAEKLAIEHGKLSKEIEQTVIKLHNYKEKLSEISLQIYENCPERCVSFSSSPLAPSSTEMYIRESLYKHGFNWAITSLNSPFQTPSFVERMKEAVGSFLVLRQRTKTNLSEEISNEN